MSKIYLSGAISVLPIDAARRAFSAAEKVLAAQGWEVVNPMKNGVPVEAPWEVHLAEDVLLLLACKAVYMMRGWRESRGARLEHAIATRVSMRIIYEEDMCDDE